VTSATTTHIGTAFTRAGVGHHPDPDEKAPTTAAPTKN